MQINPSLKFDIEIIVACELEWRHVSRSYWNGGVRRFTGHQDICRAGEREQNNRAMLAGDALNQKNEKNLEMASVCFGGRKLPNGLLRRNRPLRVGSGRSRNNKKIAVRPESFHARFQWETFEGTSFSSGRFGFAFAVAATLAGFAFVSNFCSAIFSDGRPPKLSFSPAFLTFS
jgi:hypothetical protein